MPELEDLALAVAELQIAVSRADNEAARTLDVGRPEDLQVLRLLAHRGSLRVSDIARRQATSSATASVRCDRLEKRGFVERNRSPEDRRVVLVELTDTGRSIVASSLADRRTILDRVDDPAGIAAAIRTVTAQYRLVDDHD